MELGEIVKVLEKHDPSYVRYRSCMDQSRRCLVGLASAGLDDSLMLVTTARTRFTE